MCWGFMFNESVFSGVGPCENDAGNITSLHLATRGFTNIVTAGRDCDGALSDDSRIYVDYLTGGVQLGFEVDTSGC